MGFLGEFECKIDAKGRVRLPGALKSQLHPAAQGKFVVNRGFERCLTLYPWNEWEKVRAKVDKLNTFRKKEREFVRYFYRGASEMELDSADRLNLPKHLLDYATIKGELVMAAHKNVVEIWDKKKYDDVLSMDSEFYADLAEEVMRDDEEDGADEGGA